MCEICSYRNIHPRNSIFQNLRPEPNIFSLDNTVLLSRINEYANHPLLKETLAVLVPRLVIGNGKYGETFMNPGNNKRYATEALLKHAKAHLEKLMADIADDTGPDPRHHIGAIMVNLAILAYYCEHMPERVFAKRRGNGGVVGDGEGTQKAAR